jgi:hypothetical protein
MLEFLRSLGPVAQIAAWFGTLLLTMLLGALAAGPTRLRRLASVPFIVCGLLLPLLGPSPPLLRVLLSMLGLLGALKMLQLDFEPRWQRHHAAWHGLVPFDVSTARRVPPAFDLRLAAPMLAFSALAFACAFALLRLPANGEGVRYASRMLLGAAMVYSAMEAATLGLLLAHRIAGIAVPPIQALPIAARSVGEFWGKRWNRPVSAWLGEYVFAPLRRRRRPLLGLVLVFAASAAMHAWVFYAGGGVRAAAGVALFFLLQAPWLWLESKLRVARWPALAGHAWTLGWLLLTAPLFVAPVLPGIGL